MSDVRVVTAYDIRHVAYRMWGRGKEEIAKHGHIDTEEIINKLRMMSKEYGWSFFHNNEPIAVFGAQKISDKEYSSFFVATDKFDKVARAVTRSVRDVTRAAIEAHGGGVRVELWSGVDHPDAQRWFDIVGFQPMGEKRGAFTGYVHVMRNRLTEAP